MEHSRNGWVVMGYLCLEVAWNLGAKIGRPDVPVVELFSGDELGMTSGRERTVHLVIAPGKLALGIRREAARLSGFRNDRAPCAHSGKQ